MTPESFTEEELHAYADGHLDGARRAAVDADPQAAAKAQAYRRQNEALQALFGAVADEPLPAPLCVETIEHRLAVARRRSWLRVAAAVLLLLAGGAGGWVLNDLWGQRGAAQLVLAQEAFSAHQVYVKEVRHPVEVAAEEEAHLVKWLSKRLGAPLKAPVLATAGYDLVGGRLLPSGGGPAAQFMYETADGRRLTIFIRANPSSEVVAFRFVEGTGASAFYWLEGPLGYAIIGTEPRARLLELSRAIYQQLGS
jgi:anti-sigma factor RsiW